MSPQPRGRPSSCLLAYHTRSGANNTTAPVSASPSKPTQVPTAPTPAPTPAPTHAPTPAPVGTKLYLTLHGGADRGDGPLRCWPSLPPSPSTSTHCTHTSAPGPPTSALELRTPRPRQANCALMPISATISAPGPPTRAEASSQHRGRGTATVACRGGHHGEEWVDLCTAVNTVWSYGPDGTDLGDVLKPSSDVRIPGTPLALLRRALPKGPHDVMRKCHMSKGHASGL